MHLESTGNNNGGNAGPGACALHVKEIGKSILIVAYLAKESKKSSAIANLAEFYLNSQEQNSSATSLKYRYYVY